MFDSLERHRPTALAGLRIITGLMFMQHGTQKIFSFPAEAMGPFQLMSQMGIGGVLELVGGALIVLGLFTRPVAFLMSGMMAVAYFQFHAMAGGLFPMVNGGELAALYCWVFLYLVFAGPGAFSVDGILAKKP
ncbi:MULTISPECIES: DoxX family protein [unclassified Brevundimonas]|jgi:putative oxidoreductase|uniref:DoxX family protein n=1 Tax=unclassified Brevundimonas TaxID=2622653 RepID=UPI000C4A0BB9|nr:MULTISPECIES: DoxX family protein [unclassified Brevundimonas]MAL89755.1 DoxX family protein [Brevundimonas sp.]MBU2167823.1 DoxX family protein [Alphaproteobacteria bacterium]HAJ02998.1 DoxX family protein [Brevundimonas sp.]|tara:strand:- start:4466 stop:4864 length:399 start_codon:yes stop_codon:yes gene_type:complete